MTRKPINRPKENRLAVHGRKIIPWILVCLLILSSLLPRGAQAAQAEVNGVFLFIDDYTNASIADAWAALNFTGAPIPQPSNVDDVFFEWFAPNGTSVFQQTVDPNDAAWALSSYLVKVLGTWTVNVTYTTNASVHASLSFLVVPNAWGTGSVTPRNTTVVGRSGELAILPGTQVLFPAGGALRVQGKLTAVGTAGMPIIFSSNAPVPAKGDWNVLSFIETADNSSRISRAEVRYSSGGIRVMGVSPRIDNVSFSNNEMNNLRLSYSFSSVKDITINGGVYGLVVIGSTADIARVSVAGSDYGILFQGTGGRVTDFTATSCTQIGVYVYNGSASIMDSQLIDNVIGVKAEDSAVFAENLAITRGRVGIEASDGSDAVMVNSTITDIGTLHYSAFSSSRVTARNVRLSPPTPMKREIQDSSTLIIQNYIYALVRSYDTGAVLSGAHVEVRDNGTVKGVLYSDSNGLAGPFIMTYGVYNHTAFRPNSNTVLVRLSGYIFDRNNRTVNAATGHTETFNGSIYDNDRDGIPDFVDPDDDNDGLSDQMELALGSDPKRADTDGDGMPDGYEFGNGFNLLDPSDGLGDPDGDGLTNSQEYKLGTDPRNPDSDGDGMPDGWEVAYHFNPLNGTDANQDPDADGYTNLEEFRNGTNPRNPESKPQPPLNPGFLGTGDYWPLLLLPLAALGGTVLLVILAFLTTSPRMRRRKVPPPSEPGGEV